MPVTWLAFAYQVPAEPSKARVYVWRKLKEHGAAYFKQGVALLPRSPANLTRLRALAAKINDMAGEATIAELRFVDKADEVMMIARFQDQSRSEYQALIAEMTGLRENPFSDDRAERARRLSKRYGQVRSRDYFKSAAMPEVAIALDELIGDMAHATDDLARHFAQLLLEMD